MSYLYLFIFLLLEYIYSNPKYKNTFTESKKTLLPLTIRFVTGEVVNKYLQRSMLSRKGKRNGYSTFSRRPFSRNLGRNIIMWTEIFGSVFSQQYNKLIISYD